MNHDIIIYFFVRLFSTNESFIIEIVQYLDKKTHIESKTQNFYLLFRCLAKIQ